MRHNKKKPKELTEFEKEILNYLAESGSSRARRLKFPEIILVEDYGSGVMPEFANPANPMSIKPEKVRVEDVLNFLVDMGGTEGEMVSPREAAIAKSLKDDELVNYEESIHGAQKRKFLDNTLGRGVGRSKRQLKRAVKKAFSPELLDAIYKGLPGEGNLQNYVLSGPGSNMEAEAKAMATKAAMMKYGVIDSPQMTDSDLDSINAWYKANPDRQDSFAYLFHTDTLKNEEYRKALLDFMNKF
jgi:hypothetical protein